MFTLLQQSFGGEKGGGGSLLVGQIVQLGSLSTERVDGWSSRLDRHLQ